MVGDCQVLVFKMYERTDSIGGGEGSAWLVVCCILQQVLEYDGIWSKYQILVG